MGTRRASIARATQTSNQVPAEEICGTSKCATAAGQDMVRWFAGLQEKEHVWPIGPGWSVGVQLPTV